MKQFELPLPPTTNASFKIWQGRFVETREYREYVRFAHLSVPKDIKHYPKPMKLQVWIAFHLSRDSDIDGRLKPLLDSMQGRVYDNDSQIHFLQAIKIKVASGSERCFIKILPLLEEDNQGQML